MGPGIEEAQFLDRPLALTCGSLRNIQKPLPRQVSSRGPVSMPRPGFRPRLVPAGPKRGTCRNDEEGGQHDLED